MPGARPPAANGPPVAHGDRHPAPEQLEAAPVAGAAGLMTRATLSIIALGLFYVITSTGLIAFNKYLMDKDRFPFAVVLVMMHMAFCATFSGGLYLVKPDLFPSLSDPEKRLVVDTKLIITRALPLAFFFTGTLVLSNVAYLHSSVAFLQMMKEANLVLVYVFSLAFALEKFSWRNAQILFVILVATAMTIHGEVNFSLHGFLIQLGSQLMECMKIVLQVMLLTGQAKLDVMSYVLLVTPLCFLLLAGAVCVLTVLRPNENFALPEWSDIVAWWPLLAANAMLAFTLNVAIALFMKWSSAVTYILAGIVKDAMIVICGSILLHEIITPVQTVGFAIQLGGIVVWSLMKAKPEKFEHGVLSGLQRIFLLPGSPALDKDYGALEAQLEKSKA
eukprot:TRINITY_DN81684_c0_g1_i1.p1 TRINITY_DN81684_c0_g1~~TRINITY_DN81684_c0_g1_i1.p1  ORF type:complete len:390 (+),score=92.23 TRINITY_DN81684_c0_g1_i1:151-1320(+)